MSLNYLQGINPPTWYYKIKYIFQESHLGLSRQKICEVKSQKQYFLLVGTDLSLVVTNLTFFQLVPLINVYLQMKGLLYTQ